MKEVTFYMDNYALTTRDDSTMYVLQAMVSDGRFKVGFSTIPDPEKSRQSEVIFCRFDIPVKRDFLMALCEDEPYKLFINPPTSKLRYHTKHYLSLFPRITPKTLISDDIDELVRAAMSNDGSILKPVDANGGRGIVKIDPGTDHKEIADMISHSSGGHEMVVQEYIKGVDSYGDKRINIIFYEPVTAIHRYPKEGSFICNVSSGGSMKKAQITYDDKRIIDAVIPFLKKNNIVWAGIDVIGPYLGEINVASPGLLVEADKINGNTNGLDALLDGIARR